MRKILLFSALLLSFGACDYREYPQEEEWKEEFQDEIQKEEEREINFTPGNT